jgi:glucose-1-phosphate adenylyltransferase
MGKTLALILAGGRGSRLSVLSQKRVKPALPFGGKYRIIDFVLSNCVNSGILNIGIPTQYHPHSLNNHVRSGQPWDLDRGFSGGLTLLPPCQQGGRYPDWYRGTADAVFQNVDFIIRQKADTVLVLPGDQVYRMDYDPLLQHHHERQADVTVCTVEVLLGKAPQIGIVVTSADGRVIGFHEKHPRPSSTLASMGVYVFRTEILIQRLVDDARSALSSHGIGKDVLPRMLELGDRIDAYPFGGYWRDVGTVQAYWEANMDLLGPERRLDLFDSQWSVYTRNDVRPPADIRRGAVVCDSLIADGCVIEGRVENSVLSPGVRVLAGALVRDSIVFSDCEIGPGATVERAILDKNVVVGNGAYVGLGPDLKPNRFPPAEIEAGLTLVGKNTRLPADLRVDRGRVIGSDLAEGDFANGWPENDSSGESPSIEDNVMSLPVVPTIREAGVR